MSDTALTDSANQTSTAVLDFYHDIKKFIVAVIDTSITYSSIVHGKSIVDDGQFEIGAYSVRIRNICRNGRKFVHDAGKGADIPVTVYKFTLNRLTKTTRAFGREKVTEEELLCDHFYESIGNGPRDTDLFRWEGQEREGHENYFEIENIAHIRDYLDTVKGLVDATRAYTSL